MNSVGTERDSGTIGSKENFVVVVVAIAMVRQAGTTQTSQVKPFPLPTIGRAFFQNLLDLTHVIIGPLMFGQGNLVEVKIGHGSVERHFLADAFMSLAPGKAL